MSTQETREAIHVVLVAVPLVGLQAEVQVNEPESSSMRKGQAEVGCHLSSRIFLADATCLYPFGGHIVCTLIPCAWLCRHSVTKNTRIPQTATLV